MESLFCQNPGFELFMHKFRGLFLWILNPWTKMFFERVFYNPEVDWILKKWVQEQNAMWHNYSRRTTFFWKINWNSNSVTVLFKVVSLTWYSLTTILEHDLFCSCTTVPLSSKAHNILYFSRMVQTLFLKASFEIKTR